jgi:putative flavoprotein involved in K+ transport
MTGSAIQTGDGMIDVVVIGGGQAGLSTSYWLTQHGRHHVVLEQDQIAASWRSQRWDSFCLVTPNWTVQLPGFAYQGADPDGFMGRAEIVAHLDAYARAFNPPVRTGIRVTSLEQRTAGGFVLGCGATVLKARNVVVATGSYRLPKVPDMAGQLPDELLQLHSSEYRDPGQLPNGAVLVVGSGQSGAQIAEELFEAGRQVFLSVSSCPRVPRQYRGKDALWWGVTSRLMDRTVDSLKSPAERFACHPHVSGKRGGHDINLRNLALDGVVLLGRIQSAQGRKLRVAPDLRENLRKADEFAENILTQLDQAVSKLGMPLPEDTNPRGIGPEVPHETDPILEVDLYASGMRSIVWATGYRSDFGWIRAPVFDASGYPVQRRGVTSVRGLYFVGLEWMFTQKSGLLLGVGDDAAHIASVIAGDVTSESQGAEVLA